VPSLRALNMILPLFLFIATDARDADAPALTNSRNSIPPLAAGLGAHGCHRIDE